MVRYELWFGFLYFARAYGELILVNAVNGPTLGSRGLSSYIRIQLLSLFNWIFVVTDEDLQVFTKCLENHSVKIEKAGDSKYDRVRERIEERHDYLDKVAKDLELWGRKKRLILGSAWHAEVELLLKLITAHPAYLTDWQIIIAPHDVSEKMVTWLQNKCADAGLSTCLYSQASELKSLTMS